MFRQYIEDRCQTAFYWPAFFMSNFQQGFGPKRGEDGNYVLTNVWNPDTKVPMIDAATDTGKFVAPLLLDPTRWDKRRIYGAAAFYTPTEIVDTFSKVTGRTVKYQQVPGEVFRGFQPDAIAKEITENMLLIREYKYFGPEGKGAEAELEDRLKALGEKPVDFEQFATKSHWAQFE